MDEIVVIRERLTRVEESTKSAHHRLDSVEAMQGEIHQLALSVNSLAQSVQIVARSQEDLTGRLCSVEQRTTPTVTESRVVRLEERLEELLGKPGKDWDKLKWLMITAIISFVIGVVSTHFGVS